MTRPDGVSINHFGRDLFTGAPFDRVVKSQNQLSGWNERRNQQVQQDAGRPQRRPMSAIQHSMLVLKMRIVAFTDHSKASRNGPFSWRENGSNEQILRIFPNRLGKHGLKRYDKTRQFGRQCEHTEDLSWRKFLP